MAVSVADILGPKTLLDGIKSRVKPGLTALSSLFGMNIGGGNRIQHGGRRFAYDVMNRTRRVSTGRAPGQQSSLTAPQKVGEVYGTFPRSAETIQLTDEDIFNRRRLGGPLTELDSMGAAYINRQQQYLADRFSNLIEFQVAAMCRGTYTYTQNGDDLEHTFSGGETTIDFKIPAGNKNQLNMLGGGSIIGAPWSTAGTDIPLHLFQINSALMQLTGYPLQHICLNSTTWNYVVNNTKVQAQGGSSNVVFEKLAQDENGNFEGIIRSLPWLRWHVMDHGLELYSAGSYSYSKLIPDDAIIGMPDPSGEWVQYLDGSEIVTEGPGVGATRAERYGFHPYAYPSHDPSGWNLAGVFNGIPALYNPNAIIYGDVTP